MIDPNQKTMTQNRELKTKALTKSSFLLADSFVGLWLNSITLSNKSNIWRKNRNKDWNWIKGRWTACNNSNEGSRAAHCYNVCGGSNFWRDKQLTCKHSNEGSRAAHCYNICGGFFWDKVPSFLKLKAVDHYFPVTPFVLPLSVDTHDGFERQIADD